MSSQKSLVALLAGAALGVAAGVLLAPASGEKTRKMLMKKAEDLRNQLTNLIDKGESEVYDTKVTAKKASAQASRMVHHTMDDAKSSFEDAKSAAKNA